MYLFIYCAITQAVQQPYTKCRENKTRTIFFWFAAKKNYYDCADIIKIIITYIIIYVHFLKGISYNYNLKILLSCITKLYYVYCT